MSKALHDLPHRRPSGEVTAATRTNLGRNFDLWTFVCGRCGWKVESARTVNHQQAVADALIRSHIQGHDAAPPEPQP